MTLKAFFIMCVVALLTTLADYFLKLASADHIIRRKELIVGALLYGATALGWVIAMREVRLAVLCVVFGMLTMLLGVALGVFVFGESLGRKESVGVLLALLAMALLAKFY